MSPHPMKPRPLFAGLLALSLLHPVSAQDTAPPPLPADEEVYMLPPFLVEKSVQRRVWSYLATPDLEILSTGSNQAAQEFARNYHQQEAVLRQLIPERFLWQSPIPQVLLLVDDNDGDLVSDEALQAFFARHDTVVGGGRPIRTTPNLRLVDRDRTAVFATHNFEEKDVDFLQGTRDLEVSWFAKQREADANRLHLVFTADRVAFLLNQRAPLLPAWFRAGFLNLYQQVQFGEDALGFGEAAWRTPAEADRLRLDPDYPREIEPFASFFTVNPSELSPARQLAWREQATLLTRFLLFGDDGAHRDALWAYLDRIALTGVSERSFIRCFGFDYVEARDRLSDFLPSAVLTSAVFELAEIPPAPNYSIRRATPLEVARMRAEWERLEVNFVREQHPELVDAYLGQARATVQSALAKLDDTADLEATAGLLEYDAGDHPAARRHLEAAVAQGVARPRVLQVLAQLRYDEARARLPSDALLTTEHTGPLLHLLRAAAAQRPPLPEVYALLGRIWMEADYAPAPTDFNQLLEGVKYFPDQPAVITRTAIVLASHGHLERALRLIAHGLNYARNDHTRATYEELQQRLQQAQQAHL